jgi:peptide/nickel transport system substrate-binding protein
MRWLRHAWPCVLALAAADAAAQRPADRGSITIVIGAEPTLPVPTLSNRKQNIDVAALLFLPLARPNRALEVADEGAYEPALARRWTRRDSLTLAFDLDPRARWHDGTPVTSRDVVWSLTRARDSAVAPTYALLLRRVAGAEAEGPHRVVVRFREAYAEQMYDAVFHAPPLPAHLLDTVPPARLATSPFAGAPVGNGPYRWGRADPGRQLELVANQDFFLGAPRLERVVFLLVRGAEAQLNLLLDGSADAFEGFLIARNIPPIVARPFLRIHTFPSLSVGYLLFNHRAPGDRTRPHPILADPAVRTAIAHAIDRRQLLRAVFGPYGSLAEGPFGRASWVRRVAPEGPRFDPARARRLLAERGWRDSDGDGILDRDGRPLSLRLTYPGTSVPRVALAEAVQDMLRRVGIRIELIRLDGPVWAERRGRGEFDIDFSQAGLDPTPSGLVQSWSCAGLQGDSNVGGVCDEAFDRALARAIAETRDPRGAWRDAIAALQAATPAVFMYSPADVVVLHERYRDVSFRSESPWADLWRWSVDPARRLPRDDVPGRR